MAQKEDSATQDAGAEDKKKLINTENIVDQERLSFLKALADRSFDERERENYSTDDERYQAPKRDDESKADSVDGDTDEGSSGGDKGGDEPDEFVTIKVDGQERQVRLSEVRDAGIRSLQKESAAEKRLEEVSILLKELKAQKEATDVKKTSDTQQREAIDPQTRLDAAIDAVTDAQAYGTPDEYKAAIRELNAAQLAMVGGANKREELESIVQQQFQLRAQQEEARNNDKILAEISKPTSEGGFKDLLDDDRALALYYNEVERLRAAGAPNVYETYRTAGDSIRSFLGWPGSNNTASKSGQSNRSEKFKTSEKIKTTGASAGGGSTDKEPSREDIIRSGMEFLRKSRGQM